MGIKWTVLIRQNDLGVLKVFDNYIFFRNCQKLKQQNFLCIFGQIPLYFKSAGSHRQMMINLSENFCVHSVVLKTSQTKCVACIFCQFYVELHASFEELQISLFQNFNFDTAHCHSLLYHCQPWLRDFYPQTDRYR